MKALPFIALGGVAIAYLFYKKNQAAGPSLPYSDPKNYQPSQPSQQYPWQPIVPPRADNANQPWYVGSQQFSGNPSAVQSLALDIKAGSSVVHSLTDIWGDLSGVFGSKTDDPASNLMSTDDYWLGADMEPYDYEDNYDYDVSDSDWEYDNTWA